MTSCVYVRIVTDSELHSHKLGIPKVWLWLPFIKLQRKSTSQNRNDMKIQIASNSLINDVLFNEFHWWLLVVHNLLRICLVSKISPQIGLNDSIVCLAIRYEWTCRLELCRWRSGSKERIGQPWNFCGLIRGFGRKMRRLHCHSFWNEKSNKACA